MKEPRNIIKRGAVAMCLALAAILLNGCTPSHVFPPIPDPDGTVRGPIEEFHPGDLVVIKFASLGVTKNDHEERVKDDGTITPPDIGTVKAQGKSSGQLQKELQQEYNKLYKNFTVTVRSGDRFYYVLGEVRMPGPKPYLGESDVLKAISAASGFTEYANKKNIRLIHPNGTTDIVNYEDAISDPVRNLVVYPGDQIVVRRRIF
jgi:protein involved in polysaccharide export with SLBB domain